MDAKPNHRPEEILSRHRSKAQHLQLTQSFQSSAAETQPDKMDRKREDHRVENQHGERLTSTGCRNTWSQTTSIGTHPREGPHDNSDVNREAGHTGTTVGM